MTDRDPNRQATNPQDTNPQDTNPQDTNPQGEHQSGNAGSAGSNGHDGTFTEEFKVSGEAVVSKIKELLREGNVRRITIKNDDGRTLIEIPLTIGVIGTLLLPVWAGIGAIAALAANLTIAVQRPFPKPQGSVAVSTSATTDANVTGGGNGEPDA